MSELRNQLMGGGASINPAIALGVTSPNQGQGQINPLGMAGQFAQIQNAMNENRLFQQTFAGRQRLGEIMATNPGDSWINAAMHDPIAGPFAGAAALQLKQMQVAMADLSQKNIGIGKDAMGVFTNAMVPVYSALVNGDMASARAGITGAIENARTVLPPDVYNRVAPGFEAFQKSLVDGLPADPGQATAMMADRLKGKLIAGGMSPEHVYGSAGQIMPAVHTITTPTGTQTGVISSDMHGNPMWQPIGRATDAPAGTTEPVTSDMPGPPAGATVGSYATEPGPGPDQAGLPGVDRQALPSAEALGGPTSLMPEAPVRMAGGPRTAAPPDRSLMGPSVTRQREMEQTGDASKLVIDEAEQAPGHLMNTARKLDILQNALEEFTSGGLMEDKTHLATVVQGVGRAFGMTEKDIDALNAKIMGGGPGSLPAAQVFTATIRPYAVNMLKEAATGTGRVMLPEVQAFMTMIDKDIDPRALSTLLNNEGRQALQIGADRLEKYGQFKQDMAAGKLPPGLDNMADFPRWYWQHADLDKLPTTVGGGKGTYIGPRPLYETPEDVDNAVKGNPVGGKTYPGYKLSKERATVILKNKFGFPEMGKEAPATGVPSGFLVPGTDFPLEAGSR